MARPLNTEDQIKRLTKAVKFGRMFGMSAQRVSEMVGKDAHFQKTLESARKDGQRYADKYDTKVGLFVNQDGTVLSRELKYFQPPMMAFEIIEPRKRKDTKT
jgi:hypothetical protein